MLSDTKDVGKDWCRFKQEVASEICQYFQKYDDVDRSVANWTVKD